MKILVIFTGGTIGSRVKEGWADVDPSMGFSLLKPFQSDPEIEFSSSTPFFVLSENLSANQINLLQNEIEENLEKGFDGIIVTHGTDTLQYSASAMEFAFSDAKIPIVFVSANFPLEDPKTNGFDNFKAALELIKTKKASGVFVSYRNQNEKRVKLYFPSRILQYRELDSDLFGIDPEPFAVFEDGIEFCKSSFSPEAPIGKVEYVFDPKILSIESHPANGYSDSLSGIKAILLKPYHSGTLPTASPAFCDFCLKAKEKKIPVFACNISYEVSYKSTELYEKLGIRPIPKITYVSIYMKIWAAISCGERPDAFIKENAE